jgi:GNAT superfamily N-acetyltransferase
VWTVRAEPTDSPAANALLRAYFKELIDRFNGKEMPEEEVDIEMEADPSTGFAAFLVSYYDGKPAGCVGLRVSGDLTRMYVLPAYRRRGGGRFLLEAIEETARELGFDRIRIDTRDDLVEARALYVASGYEEVAPFNAAPYAEHWYEKHL